MKLLQLLALVGESGACASRSRSRARRTSTSPVNIIATAASSTTTLSRANPMAQVPTLECSTTARQLVAVAGDPRVSRGALPDAAAAAARIRTCARARGARRDRQLRHPAAAEPADASKRVKELGGRRRQRGRAHFIAARPRMRSSASRGATRRAASSSATRRRSPTVCLVPQLYAARRFGARPRAAAAARARRRARASRCPRSKLRTPTAARRAAVGRRAMAKLESLGIKQDRSRSTTTSTTSSASRRFSLDKLDFAEIGVRRRSSSAKGGSARPCSRPATSPSCAASRSARAGAPGASCASTPTASARWSSRSRTSSRRSRCSRSAAARSITDIAAFTRRRRHAARCSRSPRRSATPRSASSSAAAIAALFPGSSTHDKPRGGDEPLRLQARSITSPPNFQTMKPALLWMEHVLGFERFWEVAVPHQRRRRREREHGLGPQVDRDVGSALAA